MNITKCSCHWLWYYGKWYCSAIMQCKHSCYIVLDLKTEISKKAKKRIFESKPSLLIDKSKIDNIKVGNVEENFDVVENS